MQLSTTFRHMDASQAVRQCAEDRLNRIRKYIHGDPLSAHAVFAVERNQHMAELSIRLPNGMVVQARESTEDMYSSIDLAAARIERQVRKWKDRIRDHKPHGGPAHAIRQTVLDAGALEPDGKGKSKKATAKSGAAKTKVKKAGSFMPVAPAIKVVREQTFTIRRMRVEDAVMEMSLLENDFFVFTDVDSHGISVVYRRKDGNYGLIETGGRMPSS